VLVGFCEPSPLPFASRSHCRNARRSTPRSGDDGEARQLRDRDRSLALRRDDALVDHADERQRPAELEPDVLADEHRLQPHRADSL
jgi:hypothetical protein